MHPSMTAWFQKMVPKRAVVAFGRRVEILWQLTAAGLGLALLAAFGSPTMVVVGLIGVLVVWEVTGRLARSHVEVQDERLRQQPTERRLAYLASLAISLAYLVQTLVAWQWLMPAGDNSIVVEVLAAIVLVGWLVLQVLRQSWHLSFALPALMSLALVAPVSSIHWQEGPLFSSAVWIRLVIVLAVAGVIYLWAHPVGERTRWLNRLGQMLIVVPALASLLLLVQVSPGQFAVERLSDRWVLFVFLAMGALLLVTLWWTGVLFRGSMLRDAHRLYWSGRPMLGDLPMDATLVLGATPVFALAPHSSWTHWLLTAGLFTLAALSRAVIELRKSRQQRRSKPTNGVKAASSSTPPPVDNGANAPDTPRFVLPTL
jgi:hypothetical protein